MKLLRLGKNSLVSQSRGRQFSLLVRTELTQELLRTLSDEQRRNFYRSDGRIDSCPASLAKSGADLAARNPAFRYAQCGLHVLHFRGCLIFWRHGAIPAEF